MPVTTTAQKVTLPDPAGGASQDSVTDVLIVLMTCVKPPGHALPMGCVMVVPTTEVVPSLATPKLVGVVPPANAAMMNPLNCAPLILSV